MGWGKLGESQLRNNPLLRRLVVIATVPTRCMRRQDSEPEPLLKVRQGRYRTVRHDLAPGTGLATRAGTRNPFRLLRCVHTRCTRCRWRGRDEGVSCRRLATSCGVGHLTSPELLEAVEARQFLAKLLVSGHWRGRSVLATRNWRDGDGFPVYIQYRSRCASSRYRDTSLIRTSFPPLGPPFGSRHLIRWFLGRGCFL